MQEIRHIGISTGYPRRPAENVKFPDMVAVDPISASAAVRRHFWPFPSRPRFISGQIGVKFADTAGGATPSTKTDCARYQEGVAILLS